MISQRLDVSSVESWVIMQMSARMTKNQVGMAVMRLFATTCYEDAEDDKNESGDGENKLESKPPEDDDRRMGPGTPRNTEEPQGTPPMQSYIFTTQLTNEWAMSTIEDNSATPRDTSSVRSWMESSKYGEYEKSRNMINVPLAREEQTLEYRSNNVPRTVKDVVHAQPSVSHEEDEIQNTNFERVPIKPPSEDPVEDDRKPAAKRIKKEPEDDAQSVTQDEPKVETIVKPWDDKKDYEAIFRKYISIGDDGEEHYDVIDMERAFVTVMGRARAMMNHAGFTMAKRQQLWSEAAQTATMLDNILVQESAKSPPFTQFFGVDAKYVKHLRVFSEMCVVADTDNKVGRTKIDPRGKISLFVGYSTQHAGDVYRLLNPKTSRVIHSRDVKWIGKMWAEFYKIKMIDRASGYVDPDEDLQLEQEDQDEQEEEIEPEEDEPEVIQVGKSQAEEPTERTQLVWLVMSQWLQEQEAKLQQVTQLQQEQGKN